MRFTKDQLSDDLARVNGGDVAAFVRVYQSTSRKLFGIVVRILGRSDLADEVLQEVYLRVWQRSGDFARGQASPITWLAIIARNRALDEKRRKVGHSIEEIPALLEIASDEDIEGNHLREDELERLVMCVGRLEPDQRKLVELIYFGELTREAAAVRLGRSPAIVRAKLKDALATLKSCLRDG